MVIYPPGVGVRSEPQIDKKIPGLVLKQGTLVEGSVIEGGWLRISRSGYIMMKTMKGDHIVRECTVASDDKTSAYMSEFKSGLEEMGVTTDGDPFIDHYGGRAKSKVYEKIISTESVVTAPNRKPSSSIAHQSGERIWSTNLSDRNLLCMSVYGDEAVVGSADHALYSVSVRTGNKIRQLYSKSTGHSEWVTCLTHCGGEGKILSGGMDGALWLWNGSAGVSLKGHVGSISKVRVGSSTIAVSASYDRSLKIWNVANRRMSASLHGHKGAVLDFCFLGWSENLEISSVGRDGLVKIWDGKTGCEKGSFRGSEKGHVNNCISLSSDIFATGAQDGSLRLWDIRETKAISVYKLHKAGASISELGLLESDVIASCGTDGRVCLLDSRAGKITTHWEDDHENFIYSMTCMDGAVLTGGGAGNLVKRSIDGVKLFDIKIDNNAIRCISVTETNRIVTAGDDGNLIAITN